jgi:hypothetical protein
VSLENLLKIGQLKVHPADAQEIERLLIAAQRNLRDAHQKSISAETRFDAAYKAIMQSALAALMMHGYRPDTNRPGHHMTCCKARRLRSESLRRKWQCLMHFADSATLPTTRAMM